MNHNKKLLFAISIGWISVGCGPSGPTSAPEELFMGHSFFKPFANNMVSLQEANGLEAKSMELVFSGGSNGAPQAMWEDDSNRNTLQGFLDGGNVELFAMTYEPTYPTEEGYHNWIGYALESNPDVTFVLALPWSDFPESEDYDNAEDYADTWHEAHDSSWLSLVNSLRATYPDNEFLSLPYGQSALELRALFEAGNLPDVDVLTSNVNDSSTENDVGIFVDDKGHADEILVDLGTLVWGSVLYDIEPTNDFSSAVYETDLASIAKQIVDEHKED